MSTPWMVLIVLFVVTRFGAWGWRRRAYRRGSFSRWGSWGGDDAFGDSKRMEDLMATVDQRSQDVELLQSRVNELENRLDFAERLLAERRNLEITSG